MAKASGSTCVVSEVTELCPRTYACYEVEQCGLLVYKYFYHLYLFDWLQVAILVIVGVDMGTPSLITAAVGDVVLYRVYRGV